MTSTVRSLVLACVLAVMTCASAWAGAADPDALGSTIRVYGHWRLEVTDPDGTLVTVREFHNGLLPQGENALVLLLGGNRSAGGMAIQLLPTTGAPPCGGPPCTVAEPRYPAAAGPSVAKTLSKIVSTNPASITLSGSIQVPAAGTVGSVATLVASCAGIAAATGPSTISPAACQQAAGVQILITGLTQTVLSNPVPLVAGQTVLATVTLTFGTGSPATPASR
jgi:hypothetical protein